MSEEFNWGAHPIESKSGFDWSAHPVDNSKNNIMPSANPAAKGLSGVGDDLINMIYQGLSQAPGAAIDTVKGLPSELYGAARQISTDPKRAINNIVSGLAMPGRAVANAPSDIMNYLSQKGLVNPQKAQNIPRSPLDKTNIPEFFGVQGQQPGDAALQSSGYLPFGVAGEAGALTGAARAGARAGGAGAYAASQGQNPVTGALLGPVSEGMVQAPIKGIQGASSALKDIPAKYLSGNLSNEELARNLQVAEGTDTMLGDVIGSPTVKQKYENWISRTIGSGSDKKYRKISDQVQEKANNLVSNIEKDSGINFNGENQGEQIKNVLLEAKDKAMQHKNSLYHERNNIAASEGFVPDISKTIKLAKDKKEHLLSTPAILAIPGFSQLFTTSKKVASQGKEPIVQNVDPLYHNLLNQLKQKGVPESDIGSIVPGYQAESKGPLEPINLTDATNLKNSFYNMAKKFSRSDSGNDQALAQQFYDLHAQLDNDINSSIENKASSKLKKSHGEATQNYKDDYVQYLDSDLRSMFNKEKPHDLITREVVRPGRRTDAYQRIEKINQMLPEKNKSMLAAAYLQPAFDTEGNLNINTMSSLLNQLGNTQFKHLFPKESQRKQVNDFLKLKGMNEEALSRMANPKSGQRALDSLVTGMQALGAGAIGGGVHGAVPAAIGLAVPSVIANRATKYLSDPKVRENLVRKIMDYQNRQKGPQFSGQEKYNIPSKRDKQVRDFMNYLQQGSTAYGINQNKGNQ